MASVKKGTLKVACLTEIMYSEHKCKVLYTTYTDLFKIGTPLLRFTGNVDTKNYTVHTMFLFYFDLCSTVTGFSRYKWPSSGSSYKITKRIHKGTVPYILNKPNIGTPPPQAFPQSIIQLLQVKISCAYKIL